AQLLRAVGAATFRPLSLAVASVGVPLAPARRLARPVRRTGAARTLLFVHSLGRRGPPRSALPA
ncbi:hypothetical protein ABZS63_42550, partial [Streptomyces sp. NPDC005568]